MAADRGLARAGSEEGDSELPGDVRRVGRAKEGLLARQVLLGVVQTAEGLPIYHEVFDGNVVETHTLVPTLRILLERFPSIRRLVLVAKRDRATSRWPISNGASGC